MPRTSLINKQNAQTPEYATGTQATANAFLVSPEMLVREVRNLFSLCFTFEREPDEISFFIHSQARVPQTAQDMVCVAP
jgi:hypothetical protein